MLAGAADSGVKFRCVEMESAREEKGGEGGEELRLDWEGFKEAGALQGGRNERR
jgi:hypothetical protein